MARLGGNGLPVMLCWECGGVLPLGKPYAMELFLTEDGPQFRPKHKKCPEKEAKDGNESGS